MEWVNIIEKNMNNVYGIVQEAYEMKPCKRGKELYLDWTPANLHRIVFRINIDDDLFTITRYISEILFHHKEILFSRMELWMNNFAHYMSKCLKYKDFTWIKLNLDNTDTQYAGYYSFKKDGWEICIENDLGDWKIYLCNKWEEVLEEYNVRDRAKAIKKANEIYRSFATSALG